MIKRNHLVSGIYSNHGGNPGIFPFEDSGGIRPQLSYLLTTDPRQNTMVSGWHVIPDDYAGIAVISNRSVIMAINCKQQLSVPF